MCLVDLTGLRSVPVAVNVLEGILSIANLHICKKSINSRAVSSEHASSARLGIQLQKAALRTPC